MMHYGYNLNGKSHRVERCLTNFASIIDHILARHQIYLFIAKTNTKQHNKISCKETGASFMMCILCVLIVSLLKMLQEIGEFYQWARAVPEVGTTMMLATTTIEARSFSIEIQFKWVYQVFYIICSTKDLITTLIFKRGCI